MELHKSNPCLCHNLGIKQLDTLIDAILANPCFLRVF